MKGVEGEWHSINGPTGVLPAPVTRSLHEFTILDGYKRDDKTKCDDGMLE